MHTTQDKGIDRFFGAGPTDDVLTRECVVKKEKGFVSAIRNRDQ